MCSLYHVQVAFAGIDCTVDRESCQAFDVSGYPTFVYFNYGQNSQKYTGGREVRIQLLTQSRLQSLMQVSKPVPVIVLL